MRLLAFFVIFLLFLAPSISFAQEENPPKATTETGIESSPGTGAQSDSKNAPDTGKVEKTPEAVKLSNSFNQVAFELYKQIGADDNLFFSPLSISSALSMVYAGAKGQTKAEFESSLKYPFKDEEFFKALKNLDDVLLDKGEGAPLFTVANSLWPDLKTKILGSFLATLDDYFGSLIYPVDFENKEPAARAKINAWVSDATNDKIENFFPGPLPKSTKLILVNAVYFKGLWRNSFDKEKTKDIEFQTPKGNFNVPTMNIEAFYNYFEDKDFQVLEMFYKGNDTSMIVLLPKKDSSNIAALEEHLTVENLEKWTNSFKSYKVNVYIPKFKITWGTTSLLEQLKSLGLKEVFTDKADLSGISGDNSLSLSDVVHKAFVEVNEEGTEAAAATGSMMRATAIDLNPTPVFRADHPFVFLVIDKNTGNILFMGKVSDPRE
jgi:serpin B